MRRHPVADRHHRDLFARHLASLDEEPADRDIGLAVAAVIPDPGCAPLLQPNLARTLDFEKERIDRIVDPEEFKTLAGQRAVFDLSAGVARRVARGAADRRPK